MPLALLLGSAVLAMASARSGPDDVDPARLGPQVGESVPGFTLPDQRGRTHTLESLMGPKGLMLVFARATGW
jgi:cytochrome oxidase Cu insertion factor (SCO1/SenC/PrrC family)